MATATSFDRTIDADEAGEAQAPSGRALALTTAEVGAEVLAGTSGVAREALATACVGVALAIPVAVFNAYLWHRADETRECFFQARALGQYRHWCSRDLLDLHLFVATVSNPASAAGALSLNAEAITVAVVDAAAVLTRQTIEGSIADARPRQARTTAIAAIQARLDVTGFA